MVESVAAVPPAPSRAPPFTPGAGATIAGATKAVRRGCAHGDPLVLVHARALLTSTPEGVTQYLDFDLHDTAGIIREAQKTLDFGRPIALMMLGVMGHVQDTGEARAIVQDLVAHLPSGSYLAMSDGTATASG